MPPTTTKSTPCATNARSRLIDENSGRSSIDETLVAGRLRLSPEQRIKSFERAYSDARKFALAGRRSRGELV
jgi:hypothetical protein